jgi:hypothetical protein
VVDWDELDIERLADEVRAEQPGPDAEKTIWAFEEALRVARLDPGLLHYVLVAVSCCIARAEGSTPRDVFEAYFRRSVGADEWRERYVPLLS